MSTRRPTSWTCPVLLVLCFLMLSAGDALAGSKWRRKARKADDDAARKTRTTSTEDDGGNEDRDTRWSSLLWWDVGARTSDDGQLDGATTSEDMDDDDRYRCPGSYTWDTTVQEGGIDPTNVPLVDGDFRLVGDLPLVPLVQVGADKAQLVTTGAGLLVAVLDGGFDLEHPALVANLAGFSYDAIDLDDDAQDMGNGLDDDLDGLVDRGVGHGTFVAGLIARVAPGVTILPVRVRDDEGWGTNAELIRGLEHARDAGAHVINLSVSADTVADAALTTLIRDLCVVHDIAVIVSAGNRGMDISFNQLAMSEDTLAVGAVDANDTLATFSNWSWGNWMVAAPGVDIQGPYGSGTTHAYATWSGTSFAAAFTTGAAALVRAARPDLSAKDVYVRLIRTAAPVTNLFGWPCAFGRVDAYRAVTGTP